MEKAMEKSIKNVKRQLWEVFKDDFMPSVPWRVQGPKGRLSFCRERDARAFADENIVIDAKIAQEKKDFPENFI